MKLIVATNNLGVIGKDGQIPWKCKEDMQHFKKLTIGGLVILGGNTYRSFGSKPLPGRWHYVVSNASFEENDNVVSGSLLEMVKEAFEDARLFDGEQNIWVIGGSQIYRQLLPLCEEVHWSHINDDTPGDTTFDLPSDYRGEVFHYYFEPNGRVTKSAD